MGNSVSSIFAKPARVATLAVWKDGHLMMGLRRDNMMWTTPGGHLDEAESPIAGAIRELREETGLEATPEQLQYLGSSLVSGRSGGGVELHMFQLDIGARPMLDIRNDPDNEVHGWTFVDVSNGISDGMRSALHTPKNHLLRSLGLMEFDDDAKLSAPVALRSGEYAPPVEARRMAGLGLEFAAALQRKLPAEALARAKALVAGRGLSADEVRNTAQYFTLYGDNSGESDTRGNPSDKHLECLLWGGPSGARWARALASTFGTMRLSASRLARTGTFRIDSSEVTVREYTGGAMPEGTLVVTVKHESGQSETHSWTNAPKRITAEELEHFLATKGVRLAAATEDDKTSGTDKKPTREVTSRPMHEVSSDIRQAGVDDNDQDPEGDREIPGGPRRKTDGEMNENPKRELER